MINEVKKIAVEMMFWTTCPVDDDNCFDAIMNVSKIDRNFEDKYGFFFIRFTGIYDQQSNKKRSEKENNKNSLLQV